MSDKINARIAIVTARIAKDTAELNELQALLAAAGLVDKVAAGWSVSFKVGRDKTRREVTGQVLGRGLVKDVDSVRVSIGEGLDAELFTVAVSALTSIFAPVAEQGKAELLSDAGLILQSENPSELAVVMGTDAAGISESDELLNSVLG